MPETFPKVRDDIEISPLNKQGDRPHFLVKDPVSGEIIEFGVEEHFLYSQFDGNTGTDEIRDRFAENFQVAISPKQMEGFVSLLLDKGLLQIDAWQRTWRPSEDSLFKKIKLGNPDRILSWLAVLFKWCFTLPALVFFAFCLLLAVGTALKFRGSMVWEVQLALRSGILYLLPPLLEIFIVNVAGEIAKAIACKHFDGSIARVDIIMRFRILPRLSFDMTDNLLRQDKLTRTKIIAAGPLFQIILWSIAVISWRNTPNGSGLHSFWMLFAMSAGVIITLNLTPFLRRDGYLLLCSWFEMPDLRNRSLSYVHSLLFKRRLPEPLTARERKWMKIYGIFVILFDIVFWGGLLGGIGFLLIKYLDGVGAFIFGLGLLFRFEHLLRGIFMEKPKAGIVKILMNERGSIAVRIIFKFLVLVGVAWLLLLPYEYSASGEFRLLPAQQYGVRAQIAGEIAEVYIKEGQFVKKGDVLARLVGRNQERSLEESRAAYDNVKARLDLLVGGPKEEKIAKAEQEVTAAKTALEHSEKEYKRQKQMFENKAVSEKSYDEALRIRDLNKDTYEVAVKNLELVKSGAEVEEIQALEAELRLREVEVSFSEQDLELTKLISPANGIIITAFPGQTIGQYLEVGDLFAVVEQSSTLVVEIAVPEEDISNIKIDSPVVLKTWAYPTESFKTTVTSIGSSAYEKSKGRVVRVLSEREWRVEKEETLREEGKVVRVLAELSNPESKFKTDMTGYAKIKGETMPVFMAFTKWFIRFLLVEAWSWIP